MVRAPASVVESTGPAGIIGRLVGSRTGLVLALQWITGIALLRWLWVALATLLGYRHLATINLFSNSLEIRGERRFMGVTLGQTREIVPLSAIRRIKQVADSPLWVLGVAMVAIALAAGGGVTLILWGVAGRQLSWMVLGVGVIGSGVFFDAVAYLWVRRQLDRGLSTLELHLGVRRVGLRRVPWREADRLLQALRQRLPHP